MRRSQLFLPTLKETPAEAQIVSHRLMLRAGMVRQSAAGIYTWLPMGLRVLQKIAQIVREEQNATGAQEVLMPTIQSADLWRKSGRHNDYGPEMLRLVDRHGRDMLYGPTSTYRAFLPYVSNLLYDPIPTGCPCGWFDTDGAMLGFWPGP